MCTALANGLMQPWLPRDTAATLQLPAGANASGDSSGGGSDQPLTTASGKQARKSGEKTQTALPSKPIAFSLSSEAHADVRRALEICEYALSVTNGERLGDVISLKDRFPLIKAWVLAKQLAQSPIKNYGLPTTSSPVASSGDVNATTSSGITEHVQDKYTRCMVAVEMLNRNARLASTAPAFEIRDAPSVKDTIALVEAVAGTWADRLVELEIWSNLAVLAGKFAQTDNLRYAHAKALETLSYFEKHKSDDQRYANNNNNKNNFF